MNTDSRSVTLLRHNRCNNGEESLSRNGIELAVVIIALHARVRHSYGTSYYSRGINTATIITRYIIRSSRSPVSLSPVPRRFAQFWLILSISESYIVFTHAATPYSHVPRSLHQRLKISYLRCCQKYRFVWSWVGRHWDIYLRAAFCIGRVYVYRTCVRACVYVYIMCARTRTHMHRVSSGHVGALTRGIGRA